MACLVLYQLYSFFGGPSSEDTEETKTFSAKFLAENEKKEGVVCLPSGLQYKVLRAGDGDAHPLPNSRANATMKGAARKTGRAARNSIRATTAARRLPSRPTRSFRAGRKRCS